MRVLVYDGDCALCRSLSRALVRWAGVPEDRRRSHLAFEGRDLDRLLDAGLRDELAVLDEASGEARAGLAGILWWLRDTRLSLVGRLLDRPGARAVLTPLYRLVAYNRRVIAPPPPRPVPCACDPSPHLAYEGAFAILLAGAAGLGAAVAAVAAVLALLEGPLARGDRVRPGAAVLPLLAAAAPLLAGALLARRAPVGRRLTALAHGLWPFALAATPFLLGAGAWLVLPAPAGAAGLVAGLALGAVVIGVSLRRRWRLVASWRG